MKNVFKRVLMVMMVMLLAAGAVVPAAMAAEVPVVSNADNSMSLYAGTSQTLYITVSGVRQSPTLYKWKSSNSSVVSVSSRGVIIAKKVGTATIYATRKSNGSRLSMKVTVKRNKVDNIHSRPSVTVAPKGVTFTLKSVEIASNNKVVVEYYVCCNFPSSWRASKVEYVSDAINLYNRSTGSREKVIVGDDYQVTSRTISGFKSRYGKSVQTIKVTFTGSRVHCSDVILQNYTVNDSRNAKISVKYYH